MVIQNAVSMKIHEQCPTQGQTGQARVFVKNRQSPEQVKPSIASLPNPSRASPTIQRLVAGAADAGEPKCMI